MSEFSPTFDLHSDNNAALTLTSVPAWFVWLGTWEPLDGPTADAATWAAWTGDPLWYRAAGGGR